MSFWSDFGNGISSHVRAISFIAKNNLWSYFIFPVCITIALSFFAVYSIAYIGDHFSDWIYNLLPQSKEDNSNFLDSLLDDFLYWIFDFFLAIILKWLFALVVFKIIRYLILILCSPVMTMLSKRVDEIHTGLKTPFHFGQFMQDILRSVLVVFRNLLLEFLCLFALLLFYCFVPFIGFLALPFFFIIGWYFIGFNMMDYTYERRRMKISAGARFTRKHKGIAMGNGMIYTFLLWIPFLGICIAPILSCVAATLATTEELERK